MVKAAMGNSHRPKASILTVGVDELTLGQLDRALQDTEFGLAEASREEVASRVASTEARAVVLLEWSSDEEADLLRLCAELRAAAPRERVAVVALAGLGDSEALLRAIDGPVADVLARPFSEAVLLARLRVVLRSMESARAAFTPQQALDEALRHGSGEVCVRAGDEVARVHVQAGEIAWAHVSSVPSTLADVTSLGGIELDADVIQAVKRECRERGTHFMDVLVSWGLIDRDRARSALHAFVSGRVRMILDMPGATALFLPKVRGARSSGASRAPLPEPSSGPVSARAPSSLSFGPSSTNSPSVERPAWIGDLVRAAMRLDGAQHAAAVERRKLTCIERAGDELDGRLIWSQVSALAALGPSAEEMIAVAGPRCVVTRVVTRDPSIALLVAFSSAAVSMGLARVAVSALVTKSARPPGGD